jgi:thiosulfate dehydrogenase
MRVAILGLLLAGACTTTLSEVEHGKEVFRSTTALVRSDRNTFSCATCHDDTTTPADDLIRPGHSLVGVTARERFWGGQVIRLEDAVDTCLVSFMHGQPLDPESQEARSLYAYLVSITPAGSPSEPLPMTVVENIVPITLAGEAGRGQDLYRRACASCHGAAHTGAGQTLDEAVTLPEVADEYAELFPTTPPGVVFTEVIRHGRFFNVGGTMPLYALEFLADQDIADILAYLELPSTTE